MSAPRVDHIVIAVGDLERAHEWMAERFGLVSIPGGRHESLGTENRLILLDDCYLELLAVRDRSSVGHSWLATVADSARAEGEPLVTWALAVDDLQETRTRLATSVPAAWPPEETGSRATVDGGRVAWHIQHLEATSPPPRTRPGLPFLIEWQGRRPVESDPNAAVERSHRLGCVTIGPDDGLVSALGAPGFVVCDTTADRGIVAVTMTSDKGQEVRLDRKTLEGLP